MQIRGAGSGCRSFGSVEAGGDATIEIVRPEGATRGAFVGLFAASGDATMVVREGSLAADLFDNMLNLNETSFFAARRGSQVTVDDGTYGVTIWEADPAVSVFSASEQAELHIDRGRFQVETKVQPTSSIARAVYATGQSRTQIRGGNFEFGSEFADVRHLEARDSAAVTLYGSDFNYPLFEPIPPLEGMITGREPTSATPASMANSTAATWSRSSSGASTNQVRKPVGKTVTGTETCSSTAATW